MLRYMYCMPKYIRCAEIHVYTLHVIILSPDFDPEFNLLCV